MKTETYALCSISLFSMTQDLRRWRFDYFANLLSFLLKCITVQLYSHTHHHAPSRTHTHKILLVSYIFSHVFESQLFNLIERNIRIEVLLFTYSWLFNHLMVDNVTHKRNVINYKSTGYFRYELNRHPIPSLRLQRF